MPPSNFRLRFDHDWKHLMLVGGSLSLAYAIAFLTTMNQWINFWLRGSYYFSYQILFLAVLLLIFMLRLCSHDSGPTLGFSIIISMEGS